MKRPVYAVTYGFGLFEISRVESRILPSSQSLYLLEHKSMLHVTLFNVYVQCLYTYSVCIRTVFVYVQCLYMYSVCISTVFVYAQCLYTYNVCICTVFVHVQCLYRHSVCILQCLYTYSVCIRTVFVYVQCLYTYSVCRVDKCRVQIVSAFREGALRMWR
jgi:hypothetical protein